MRLALCIAIATVLWTSLVYEMASPLFHRGEW